MNRRLGAQQRTSATAALPAERSRHTHTGTSEESSAKHSTANHRPAANMLGQPGQSALYVPYESVPATHRCVFLPFSQHVCGILLLRSYSGGVSAKALQQLQEIKCFRSHAAKCLYKVYVQGGRIYMHADKLQLSVFFCFFFCGREGSWLFYLFKLLNCLWGVSVSMCS